jgi:hypothetical protein
VSAALPPSSVDAARTEIARLTAELAKYVGHEPTVAEEMAYAWQQVDRLRAERNGARSIAVALEQENARLQQVIGHLLTTCLERDRLTVWALDLDAMLGRVELTDLGNSRVEIAYQWLQERLAAPGGASCRP